MKNTFIAIGVCFLAGCATGGVSVTRDYSARTTLSESSPHTRGRNSEYRAPVTIENAQLLSTQEFLELRSQCLDPLLQGPWRYVIDGVTLDSEDGQEKEWTLWIALDTGAHVKVENFGAWDESTRSHFRAGYQRAARGLEQARGEDPALDRYMDHWTKRRRARVAASF